MRQKIVESLRAKYSTSQKYAKEVLESIKWDPQGYIFDLSVEIACMMASAHPYIPVKERNQSTTWCAALIAKSLRRHLLWVDTTTVQCTICAIGNSDRPA